MTPSTYQCDRVPPCELTPPPVHPDASNPAAVKATPGRYASDLAAEL